MHHLVSTGLLCAPLTCVVHHRPALCTMVCVCLMSNQFTGEVPTVKVKCYTGQGQSNVGRSKKRGSNQKQVGSHHCQVASLILSLRQDWLMPTRATVLSTLCQNRCPIPLNPIFAYMPRTMLYPNISQTYILLIVEANEKVPALVHPPTPFS